LAIIQEIGQVGASETINYGTKFQSP